MGGRARRHRVNGFVKQPEVLRAAAAILWDVLIVDEAHQVAAAAQRASAVARLANRARHVALVTATPHAGDQTTYDALCRIGRLDADDRIALFRRTRSDVGLGRARHVHLLAVRLSDDERDMHRLLSSYARRVWRTGETHGKPAAQLVATILSKRAFSSASSLAASVERRLALLTGGAQPLQAGLPFAADEDDADVDPPLGTPVFDRADEERRTLEEILKIALRARAGERKVAVLQRLLNRINEPALVFTEYRDTLLTLESAVQPWRPAILHGGLSRPQRRLAVDAFNSGAAGVLLATDAGSEGLNLQSRCRLVINLELPWNPIRLEQRIGRVDRLGQSRTVHAINLFARDTAESFVLARLAGRVEQIRRSLASFDNPVFRRTEMEIASEIFDDANPGTAL
jgi:superfamily II DNA or RNA helicase